MARNAVYYTEGNTAQKAWHGEEERALRSVQAAHRKRAHRVHNLFYLFFLTLSLAAAGAVLFYYISLQSSILKSADHISDMEKELSALTKENDETYNRINGNIDLEEIRRIAITEYGMRYVEEGQIITYRDDGGTDYVRQRAEIPVAD